MGVVCGLGGGPHPPVFFFLPGAGFGIGIGMKDYVVQSLDGMICRFIFFCPLFCPTVPHFENFLQGKRRRK